MADLPETITLCGVELKRDNHYLAHDQLVKYADPNWPMEIVRSRQGDRHIWWGAAEVCGVEFSSSDLHNNEGGLEAVIRTLEGKIRSELHRLEVLQTWAKGAPP